MTWSKQFTASVGVADADTDNGVSMQTVLDELFMTWLPSRGWSTYQQTNPPAPGNLQDVYYWFEKQIRCIDNSYYNHRIEFVYRSNGAEAFGFKSWDDGVFADTVVPAPYFETPLNDAVEGIWEFWISDQDDNSFAILNKGIQPGVIGFMPPSGSIFPGKPFANQYPSANAPVFPCDGLSWWVSSASAVATAPYLLTTEASQSANFEPCTIKLNFAAVKNGQATSSNPAFITTTNDVASIVDIRQAGAVESKLTTPNTMLIDGDYYITIGLTNNKILLNTGTVDPLF